MSTLLEQLEIRLCLSGETGLRGDYYESATDIFSASSPAVGTLPTYSGTSPTVDAYPAPAATEIRWSGQVQSEEAGSYVFHVITDGGVRLWVNNQLILSNWTPPGVSTDQASTAITLAASTQYNIRLDIISASSGVELDWVRPTGVREVVPQAQLYPFSQPISITTGGLYVGSWESTNYLQRTIGVHTTQPVTIEDSTIRGAGTLVQDTVPNTQISLLNNFAYGLNPNVVGALKGPFLNDQGGASLAVDNNYINGVGGYGILVYGLNGTGSQTIKILNNYILNSDGRYSNGAGGYETSGVETHAIGVQNVYGVSNMEIAWNYIENDPGQCNVNDVINLFEDNGTPTSPINVHDNFVYGLYDLNISTVWDSGSGITTDGDQAAQLALEPAYINIYNNQVIQTGSAGIGVPTGHDISVYNNRLVNTGYLPNGTPIFASGTGLYINDLYNSGSSLFYNDGAYNNISGWIDPPHSQQNGSANVEQNDYSFVSNTSSLTYNNANMAGTINSTSVTAELSFWQAKLAANHEFVGASPLPSALLQLTSPDVNPTPAVTISAPGESFNAQTYSLATAIVYGANGSIVTDGAVTFTYYNQGSTIALTSPPTNAGTYSVVANFSGDSNYNSASSNPAAFTISQAAPTLTATAPSETYNAQPYSLAVPTITGLGGVSIPDGAVTLTYYPQGSTTPLPSAPTNAGTYCVVATFSGDTNYTSATSTATTFTIAPATPAVTTTAPSETYNALPYSAATATATGVGGVSIADGSLAFTYYAQGSSIPLISVPTDAGAYSVVATFSGDTNYATAAGNPTPFAITQATPAVTTTAPSETYNAQPYSAAAATVTGVGSASIADGSLTFTYCAQGSSIPLISVPTDPGAYSVVATFSGDTDYSSYSSSPAIFTITQATPTVALTAPNETYNAQPYSLAAATVTGLGGAFILDGAVTLTYYPQGSTTALPSAPTDAGTYNVIATFSGDTDYASVPSAAASFTINQATPTITVIAPSETNNGQPYSLATTTVTGLGGLSIPDGSIILTYYAQGSSTPLTSAPTNAGTYQVVANFSGDTDYTSALSTAATFTISLAPVGSTTGDAPGSNSGAGTSPAAPSTPSGFNWTTYRKLHRGGSWNFWRTAFA